MERQKRLGQQNKYSHEIFPNQKKLGNLSNYLLNQRSRLDDDVVVDMHMGHHLQELEIDPTLFISFLDIAIKRVGDNELCGKRIDISFSKAGYFLFFTCSNTADPNATILDGENDPEIKMLKKQLDLLYSRKHVLHIINHERLYQVDLVLQLN
jgi:LytS/YehU family sensor histidine kinase